MKILNKKAFTLLEIVVSLFIITSVIFCSTMVYNFYHRAKYKQRLYEQMYVTVLSLKEWLELQDLSTWGVKEGCLNEFEYRIKVSPVKKLKNYVYFNPLQMMLIGESKEGNTGVFTLTLYEVKIRLQRVGGRIRKDFFFYITQYKTK